MIHEHYHSLFSIIKETFMEYGKPLIILVWAFIVAHTPLDNFLDYNWNAWLPFMEVVKIFTSTLVMIITVIIMIYRTIKKRNGDIKIEV